MQRYARGESIRQIAREERRDRATVTKIVRSDEMQAFVQEMRERFYGLGFDALDAVSHALRKRKDARIGYQILKDIGAAPSAEQRLAIATQPASIDRSTLTPFEIAVAEDENGQINRVAYGAACAMEASAETYGTTLPTAEEFRHLRRVAQVADEITEGRFDQICAAGNRSEEKRIRDMAEKIVSHDEHLRALATHSNGASAPIPGRNNTDFPKRRELEFPALVRRALANRTGQR
jgi:hypothetical protein